MRNEYKWMVAIVAVAIVVIAAAALYLSDRDDGDGIQKHPDRYPGAVSVESFELNSEE